MSLAFTLFHFFSFQAVPCHSHASPLHLSHTISSYLLLRHSSSGLTQALVHIILFQSNPVSHIIFPPAVGRDQAEVQCFPRTHSLSPLSSVPPIEPATFSDSGRAIPAPWFQWTERRCSKQGCSCIQAWAGYWVYCLVFLYFSVGTQDHCFTFYKSHWPLWEDWGQ